LSSEPERIAAPYNRGYDKNGERTVGSKRLLGIFGGESGVGMNPYRKMKRRKSDYALVVGTLLIVAVLVVWAFAG
jgi:hypothetical protein